MVAKSLLANFRTGKPVDADTLNVENMIRLLKRFESSGVYPYRAVGLVNRDRGRDLNFKLAQRSAGSLQRAFEEVHQAIAPDLDRSAFAHKTIAALNTLLDKTATPADVERTSIYLNALLVALEAL